MVHIIGNEDKLLNLVKKFEKLFFIQLKDQDKSIVLNCVIDIYVNLLQMNASCIYD